MLHHPLYGNYRPHQQPYRSVLLEYGLSASTLRERGISPDEAEEGVGGVGADAASFHRVNVDQESLHFIEEALLVFQSSRVLTPDMAPPVFLRDCSVLDFELMRMPLSQAGLPDYYLEPTA